MPDRKCDCPGCKCTIKDGEHAYAVHGKHYCCEACAHHHKGGRGMFQQGLPVRASQVSVPIKKWSLIRLHFQFQAVVIQPLYMPHRALQASAFDRDHDGFRLIKIFR